MHYNDKDHNCKKHYDEETIQWRDKVFLPQIALKEESYNPYQIIKLEYKPTYQEEEYYTKEYGDIEFHEWLRKQKNKCIAILAEIVSAPRLDPAIEILRSHVSQMKTITIDDYRKKKCIGSTKVEWLKQLKKKYGINILRFLHATLDHSSYNNPKGMGQTIIQQAYSQKLGQKLDQYKL